MPTKEDSEYKLLRLRFANESEHLHRKGLWSRAERIGELPEDAMRTIKEETGGLVQDSLVLDYDHWQSCETHSRSSLESCLT